MVKSSLPAALKRPPQYANGVLPRLMSASMFVSADAMAPSRPAFCAIVATTDDAAACVAPVIATAGALAPAALLAPVAVLLALALAACAESASRLASRSFLSWATSAVRCLSLSSVEMTVVERAHHVGVVGERGSGGRSRCRRRRRGQQFLERRQRERRTGGARGRREARAKRGGAQQERRTKNGATRAGNRSTHTRKRRHRKDHDDRQCAGDRAST